MTRAVLISAATILVSLDSQAVTPDSNNPYHGIVDRNVFALKEIPPPPPPPNPDANKPPPPPIQLVGITTLFGNPRAFLTLTLPAKGQEPAKALSLMLNENQRDGEVEVIKIDVANKTVLVNNYGVQTNLTFDKPKSSTGPGTTTTAANTAPAQGGVFTPGGMGSKSIPTSIPTRMVRLGNPPTVPGTQNSGGSPAAFTPGSSALTTGGTTFTPGSTIPQPAQQQPESMDNLTPAQKEILMEAAHQAALKNNDPSASVFPPSYLNPTRNLTPTNGSPAVPNPGQKFFRP